MKKKIKLGNKILQNPFVLAPMCQYMATKGLPSPWHYQHLGKAMYSGFGMIMLESTAVSSEGRISKSDLVLDKNTKVKYYKKLVSFLKKISHTKIGIQISHAGRKGSSQIPWVKSNSSLNKSLSWQTVSASNIKKDKNWPKPKKLTTKEIEKIKNKFKNSAYFAMKSGFDCIEIHMAHGYLLHQFFSPISNNRKDKYGGNLKNRCRLLVDIAKEIKKIPMSKNTIIRARITGKDWLDNGSTEDDAIYLAKQLKKIGLNYICITGGGIKTKTKLNTKIKYNLDIAKKIKKKTNIKVRVAGNFYNIKEAIEIIKKENIDMIAFGRAFLRNPHFMFNDLSNFFDENYIPEPYLRAFK